MADVRTSLTAMRDARKRKGWSLDDLGYVTGRTKGYLSRVERGLQRPSRTSAVVIARALDLRPQEVRGEDAA